MLITAIIDDVVMFGMYYYNSLFDVGPSSLCARLGSSYAGKTSYCLNASTLVTLSTAEQEHTFLDNSFCKAF